MLGRPRVHYRTIDSTNRRARELAEAGAPHGTLVTADEQSAGRGRQGRRWLAPPRTALLMSLILRGLDPLVSLRAGVAVTDVTGGAVKWPNDVLIEGRKVAGILVEGRPQEGWAVLGIGLNVVAADLPGELRGAATSLERGPAEIDDVLADVLFALGHRLGEPPELVLDAFRARDALHGKRIRWSGHTGAAAGITPEGGLRVAMESGEETILDAGEVHLLGGAP